MLKSISLESLRVNRINCDKQSISIEDLRKKSEKSALKAAKSEWKKNNLDYKFTLLKK